MKFNMKINTVFALVMFSIIIILSRLQTYDGLLGLDTVTYSVIANELLEGRSLYTDLWDHKPPAIHLTFAAVQALVGQGPQSFFLLSSFASILTLLGVYSAASAGGRGARVGVWAAAIWAVISRQVYLGTDSPNTEEFINICVIWTFALFLRSEEAFRDWKKIVIAGALFALASLYKPVAVVVAIVFSLVHLFFTRGNKTERRRAFFQVSIMAAVGVGAWVMTAGYFFFQNRFADFYYAVFEFNQNYAGNPVQNIIKGFQGNYLYRWFLSPLLLLFAISSIGVLLSLKNKISRSQAMMAGYVLSVIVMISLPGRYFAHYYQFWLPLLAVSTAWSLQALVDQLKNNNFVSSNIIVSTFLLIQLFLQVITYTQYQQRWNTAYFGSYRVVKNLSKTMGSFLLPEETFHAFGFGVGLFYYAHRSPQTGLIATWGLKNGTRASQFTERLKRDLSTPAVDLLVVDPWFLKIIENYKDIFINYTKFPRENKYSPFELYYLKGSPLEKRLLSNPLGEQHGNG
jgi:4-amino-4-deoxy-L-arabinose transferase-like glycosyltransferase